MTKPKPIIYSADFIDPVDSAKRVLKKEAEALQTLIDSLDLELGNRVGETVRLLHNLRGRIVTTGMGKSGHIARKIAATFASTGAPALFVHPAEASHGDLGMIAPGDAVVLLSNSGETAELSDIITHCRRFSIPMIAITGRAHSTLAEAANVALVLPQVPEACPMGLAPTNSTTMMLALGDALAVALLEQEGFSKEKFYALHPGGRLGRRLVRVSDLHRTGDALPLVREDTTMADTLIEMTRKSLGCAGVVDERGRLVGIITDGDLRRHMARDLLGRRARDVMTPDPKTIAASSLASDALGWMTVANKGRGITSLFVVDDQRMDGPPIGILHVHDCLRAGVDMDARSPRDSE
ncbi:MAG: KpsF/GutQ family sugar-phosphate isomerase [Alphaproteobacteria bacterium]|nr:KpsF/GutQ family sugar-phosphate isomerase [Alphaproteobacteria bacterium]